MELPKFDVPGTIIILVLTALAGYLWIYGEDLGILRLLGFVWFWPGVVLSFVALRDKL